ncbi:cyclase family protein [Microbacterium sp. zg.B48]|uniref:cyclase family protein n=1 Tax=Microbacterium sp. zg.B48 TaxID=2969408 RepID=UPI00214ACCCF|nr:cyclase family protein [Microbacterium sp. zg.B48]MCR2762478.1 cyclase family protein [Microbacterium sp. zg.B48]
MTMNNPDSEYGPPVVLEAMKLIREGRIIELNHVVTPSVPRVPNAMGPYSLGTWQHPDSSRKRYEAKGAVNGIGFFDERIEMDFHTGTHIDALGHATQHRKLFGGVSIDDVVTDRGLTSLGSEEIPAFMTPALVIDMPTVLGREMQAGEVVNGAHLKKACEDFGIEICPGDIVFIRTGWDAWYEADPLKYASSAPGLSADGARWLADKHVLAVGADNMSVEVVPSEDPAHPYLVHQILLATHGIFMIEQAYLAPMKDSRGQKFCCIAMGPRFKGTTAALLRLVAVV